MFNSDDEFVAWLNTEGKEHMEAGGGEKAISQQGNWLEE
jgi:hypothetical protein